MTTDEKIEMLDAQLDMALCDRLIVVEDIYSGVPILIAERNGVELDIMPLHCDGH